MVKTRKVWTIERVGIGKAVAEKFSKENWKVGTPARRVELLNETQKSKYFCISFRCYGSK